jgi:uncharacterized protein YdeI (YjbR/CyaY-like superfamily)
MGDILCDQRIHLDPSSCKALKDTEQLGCFKSLAISYRREYIRCIEEAKWVDTRGCRIHKTTEILYENIKAHAKT